MKLSFTVIGKPVAKQRVNHFIRKGTDRIGTSTPPETRMYENMVAMSAHVALKESKTERFSGPIKLTVTSFLLIPETRKKKLQEGQPHTQRPDADNLLKAICDGCNGVVWNDDCAVYQKHVTKLWTHLQPRTEVLVEVEDGQEKS